MKSSAILVLLTSALMAATSSDLRTGAIEPRLEAHPLMQHLEVTIAKMDQGERSLEYRESLTFLKEHTRETTAALTPFLLEQPGGFRKWQLAYLVGEFGDASAVRLLRELAETPLPEPQTTHAGSHETDLVYTEDVASRVQAVVSTARIASRHPELRDWIVSELVTLAHEVPLVKSTAIFELRKLLGDDLQTLRAQFGPDDAPLFEPFTPPSGWQH
jgi:hypothetical protein